MAKAIITNRIYLDNPGILVTKKITKELTYKFVKNTNGGKFSTIETIRNYKILPGNILSIPQARIDLIPTEYEIVDKRIINSIPYPKPLFALYDEQQPIHDEINDNAIINALVGWGKSYTALWIAYKLRQKTLVVTHNTVLRDKWIDDIKELFGSEAGQIGSSVFDYKNRFITVGNIQTLANHMDKISKEFGMVILDECLDYETYVDTLEFGRKKLGTVVNQKISCHVLSMNLDTKIVEYKKVLNFFKNSEKTCLKINHSGNGSIKCTSNHNIFVYENGNINTRKASELKINDYLLQTATHHKSNRIINKEWFPIILGLILGDGHLRLDNTLSNSCRISITHGEDQLEYLKWKLTTLLNSNSKISKSKSGYCDNKVYSGTSLSFIDIETWKEMIYDNNCGNKVRVTKYIAELLTLESWALIFQDDGNSSVTNESITFSFCEFDQESCYNLIASLKTIFGLSDPKFFTCNKGFNYIRLNQEDCIKFKIKIAKLVHPNIKYKLGKFAVDQFEFPIPVIPLFNESYCVRSITSITNATLTGNNRYNIEVEDNHTYFANGILVSNCHHCPASTFAKVLDKLHARYKLGLSGTLIRKDGKQTLFKDYFGSHVLRPPQSNTLNPTIKLIRSNFGLQHDLPWADRVTKLVENQQYQKFITDLAIGYMDKGYYPLVIADRVEFLRTIADAAGDRMALITGVDGDRKLVKEQIYSGEKRGICGSRQIFAEGVSFDPLSCVILAAPISKNDSLLEQIIGRIQRKYEGKLNPIVVDIQFNGYADKAANEARVGLYIRKGWNIETL